MSHNHAKELNDYPKYKAAYFRAGKKWIEHRINRTVTLKV
jgi:predicted DNA-binding protein (MmcQ/YjbR family)